VAIDIRYQLAIKGSPDNSLTSEATLIEVNQYADSPATFRIQFALDLCDDDFPLLEDTRLKPSVNDDPLSVLVSVDNDTLCLVHGIITNRAAHVVHGGPGSYLEVRGQERRKVMDREYKVALHDGKASDVARSILESNGFEVDVADTTIEYGEDSVQLAQTGTDHAFLTQLAANNNLRFWVDYQVTGGANVKEIAHFKASPERPQNSFGLPSPLALLAPNAPPSLTINTSDDCASILAFELHSDGEAVNQVPLQQRINLDDAAVDEATNIVQTDDALNEVGPPERVISSRLITAGSVEEANLQNQAAVNDASWSVSMTVSTTAFALGGVVQPHQIIELSGSGKHADGKYFVEAVNHQIDVVDHKMTLTLKSNSLGD
jgi:phage protein D